MTQENKSGLRILLLTLCVFFLFISLWWIAARWYRVRLINEKRAEVAGLININGNSLSSNLMRRFALIEGLRAFIKTEVRLKDSLGQDDFDNFASGLYAGAKGDQGDTGYARRCGSFRISHGRQRENTRPRHFKRSAP